MVARAQSSDSDICVLVDADVVLLPETVTLLTKFSRIDRDWLLVSMSRNTSSLNEEIPAGKWAADSGDRGLIMAWNNPRNPLLGSVLPSFLYGRGAHSWWMAHEVLSSEMRLVFDASNLVLGLYPEEFSTKRGSRNSGRLLDGSWEYRANRHLAAVYGSYCYPSLRRHHSPMLYEVVKHSEDYMLRKVEEPTFSNFIKIGKEHIVHAEGDSLRKKENICLPGHLLNYSSENPEAAGVPYSLGMLLQFVADQNRSIVLGVAGASYRDMLMSWVCRLRHLGVTNFVVCALDQETYEFSILQGLPVFRDTLPPKNVSFDNCHFGTQCFKRVTKVKSRIVLKILRMGYNVLLSDVDIYWFHNPLQFLHSLGPATFAAQTDEYNETGPINLPRRLNSGFYYARSDHATITAMEMVVKHATKSNSSEQPSFYDILCGKEGVNRLGDDRCLERSTNLTIMFLNRDLFPNGAYRGLWERRDVRSACKELGCFVIHNNWVNGRKKKLLRQMASGLWDYDPSSRMCLHSWLMQVASE
ncbi:beta-arabinofuranosyltransferase RAY1 [Lolium rigidum]|uniref:beta-arabinofuranosyltransferase RAY1 n=1 Tax=Lolium rigidum TaxID=89674 RepID=UPI001F5D998E|nr:beta-arabinofuranosyltransferase RAY1 [Lolium rigidum]